VFWAPWNHFPQQIKLGFRVGHVDEPLPLRGVSHLIEHLVLSPFGQPAFDLNGQVGASITTFEADGTREEILGFVRDVTRRLADLPLDRLQEEKRVLAVEDMNYNAGAWAWMLNMRAGGDAYGRSVQRQIGLHALTAKALEAWRDGWFTRGNLAIWMTGEPPDSFGIDLVDGPRRPLPKYRPLPQLTLPAASFEGSREVRLGLVGPESDAFREAIAIGRRRLYGDLCLARGIVYDVDVDYEPVGAEELHATLSIGCRDASAPVVLDALILTLGDLRDHGPTDAELKHERELVRRTCLDFQAPLAELDGVLHDELHGRPPESNREWLASVESLTPNECARALAAAWPTSLIEAPDSVSAPPAGFSRYAADAPPLPRPTGRVFAEKAHADCPAGPCDIIVGGEHLFMQPGDGSEPWTARWEDVMAVDPQAGAVRAIITRDNRRLEISEWAYENGPALMDALRDRVPEWLWIEQSPAVRELDTAALRDLTKPERVLAELEDVAALVPDDGVVLALALAGLDHGTKPALLAVTDRHLTYAARDKHGRKRPSWESIHLHRIASARADTGDSVPRLGVEIDGRTRWYGPLESEGEAERLAAALTRATKAASPA
jgi:zinc protease